VTIGYSHSCGLLVNGSVACWGQDFFGQVGDGNDGNANELSPVLVSGSWSFSDISAGASHSCGLLTNESIVCWGNDGSGQIGNGAPSTTQYSPSLISSSQLFTQVTTGGSHSCGLLVNGSLLCWGDNSYGQLGDNNPPTDRQSPVQVLSSWSFSQITGGYFHSCRLLVNGSVACWGYDSSGELGDGSPASDKYVPVLVNSTYRFGHGQSPSGSYVLSSTLPSSLTSVGDNWTFSCMVYDTYE
ncbi:hypothetical protein KC573_04660, partial [candidate division WWE3 bacterium]|nr:hypothetical protein [candidate division WWE3 bacterium]